MRKHDRITLTQASQLTATLLQYKQDNQSCIIRLEQLQAMSQELIGRVCANNSLRKLAAGVGLHVPLRAAPRVEYDTKSKQIKDQIYELACIMTQFGEMIGADHRSEPMVRLSALKHSFGRV